MIAAGPSSRFIPTARFLSLPRLNPVWLPITLPLGPTVICTSPALPLRASITCCAFLAGRRRLHFYRGLGRRKALLSTRDGNLYVAASLAGRAAWCALTPDGHAAELVISGQGIVGLAFTPHRSLVLATGDSLMELFLDIEGRPLVWKQSLVTSDK